MAKIRAAKAALEAEAEERATAKAKEVREELKKRKAKERESGQKACGRVPVIPDPKEARPDPKAQRNFTDPESRIMKDGASKGFEQAYNAQIAVDEESQVIVAAGVTQETNDKKQLVPKNLSIADRMRRKLRTKAGQEVYRFRKAIVEPVFGQIKEARGIRRFSLRGLIKVEAEWTLVCLTHNLLKLFRSGWLQQVA